MNEDSFTSLCCRDVIDWLPNSAPQSVLDSQRPPSKSIKRDYVDALRGTIKPGDFTKAEISSVVLLDPERRIYAFCTRTAERADPNWSYIGVALKPQRERGRLKE